MSLTMNFSRHKSVYLRTLQWGLGIGSVVLAILVGVAAFVMSQNVKSLAIYDEQDKEVYEIRIDDENENKKVIVVDLSKTMKYEAASAQNKYEPSVHFKEQDFKGILGVGMQLTGTQGFGVGKDGTVILAIPALIIFSLLLGISGWSYSAIRKSYETEIKQLQIEKSLLVQGAIQERKRMFSGIHASSLNALDQLYRDLSEVIIDLPQGEVHTALQPLPNRIFDIRNALRDVIDNSYPKTLTEFGLDNALRSYFKPFKREGLTVNYEDMDVEMMRLPEKVRYIFYQVAQDAFNNAFKEEVGASKIEVKFHLREDRAVLSIEDNGIGFLIPENLTVGAIAGQFGLFQMKENAKTIGGTLDLASELGRGTRVQLTYFLSNNHLA